MSKLKQTMILAGLIMAPAGAMAAEPPPSPHTITGNVGMYSDYVFRGISQTGGDPAIQGGLDYSHSSGFYLGTWGSNVGWLEDYQGYSSGNVELDLYGGYRGTAGPISFDVGLIGYFYPGDEPAGTTKADTTEAYVALGWKWFTVKYSYALSDTVFGFGQPTGAFDADGSDYLEFNASVPIGETGLTLGAHWGTFNFKNYGAQDYTDWKISAAYDMGKLSSVMSGVTLGVAYSETDVDGGNGTAFSGPWTDGNGRDLGDGTSFVWISKAF